MDYICNSQIKIVILMSF